MGLPFLYFLSANHELISYSRSDHIAFHLSSDIRKIAVHNELIVRSSVANYILVILVSELAVQLIQEDMGVGDTEARAILKESAELGDLLNGDNEA